MREVDRARARTPIAAVDLDRTGKTVSVRSDARKTDPSATAAAGLRPVPATRTDKACARQCVGIDPDAAARRAAAVGTRIALPVRRDRARDRRRARRLELDGTAPGRAVPARAEIRGRRRRAVRRLRTGVPLAPVRARPVPASARAHRRPNTQKSSRSLHRRQWADPHHDSRPTASRPPSARDDRPFSRGVASVQPPIRNVVPSATAAL